MNTDIKDVAYMIISNVRVEKVLILSKNNGMYVVRLYSTGGAIRVSAKRLYSTQEEAEAVIGNRIEKVEDTPEEDNPFTTQQEVLHSPHYYGW